MFSACTHYLLPEVNIIYLEINTNKRSDNIYLILKKKQTSNKIMLFINSTNNKINMYINK